MKETLQEVINKLSPTVYGFYSVCLDENDMKLHGNVNRLLHTYGHRLVESVRSNGPDQGSTIYVLSEEVKPKLGTDTTWAMKMRRLENIRDQKDAHDKADAMLIAILTEKGMTKTVQEYKAIIRGY